jgi:CspA family cold shock protein
MLNDAENYHTGTVKWYAMDKGYGFIVPDNGSQDVFLHASELTKSGINALQEGNRVEYALHEKKNGKVAASDVRLI